MALFPLGILSAAGAGFDSDFELIATTLITTNTASVVFDVTGLGSRYRHLQLRAVARSNRSGTLGSPRFRFNGDAGANYAQHALLGNGSAVASDGFASINQGAIGVITATSATASAFSPIVLDILDPFSTTKNKTIRSLSGANESGASNSQIRVTSSAHFSTAAVTTITLFDDANSWVAGSRFSLYGIRG
jgi:hypothetical protein